jgi:hypothetical protein
MSFPTSPIDGQLYTSPNGTVYKYVSATDKWLKTTNVVPVTRLEKNAIINGEMRIAQRNTTFTVGQTAGLYTVDRWKQLNSHDAGNITVTQDASIPSSDYPCSLKITNAAGNDTSLSSGQYSQVWQIVEGYNFRRFVGKSGTLSFWVRSSKIGTYCVSFRNSSADRTYVAEYVVNSANTWEHKSIVLTFDYSGGGWNYDYGIGLIVSFALAGGSGYQTTKNLWQSGNYMTTSSQVNWLNETSNTFYLTGVQLELGTEATDYDHRSIGSELILCQRYYNKTYELGTVPGTITPNGPLFGYSNGNAFVYFSWNLPVAMRVSPPVPVMYSQGTGTAGKVYCNNALDYTGTFVSISERNIAIAAGTVAYAANYVQVVADAEL